MPQVDVYDIEGKVVRKVNLSDAIFNVQPNPQVVSEVVNMYLANKKNRTASTKTRAEVSGGGRKPWRQKGTGRARAGSVRSPLFKGGGVVFGPKPRKKIYHIPKKKKKIALKSVLTSKLEEDKIRVVDEIRLREPKTKELKRILFKLQGNGEKKRKTLIIMDSPSEVICKAVSNLEEVKLKNPLILNALDVMVCDWLILELATLPLLEKRA
ncbi:MAG TPA: 50S ribosomal protein L4 [Candidatus Omnitrophica bacterium]|nr:50S ribosomal protein L4 [Candidatus Omnitrophota bacterium]